MQLSGAYHWIIHPDVALLRWNSNGVAGVRIEADGKWRIWINWQHRSHGARAGSQEQGMRWITRWVAARDGIPMAWPARRTTAKPG